MAVSIKSPKSSSDMLHWQYKTLLGEVQQIELHETGECPCILNDLEPQEKCLGKHLLNVATLAAETASMDAANSKWLKELAEEATERHEQFIGFICHKGDLPDLTEWCRGWRKNHIEPSYYTCSLKQKPPAPAPEGTIIRIAGGCGPDDSACKLKVTAIDKSEGTTTSLSGLPRLVASVLESHRHTALTPQTFALGPSGTKYEFRYKVVDAAKLTVSHDPFTFEPNPKYPQELQPRLRGREANKQQVGNIAKNLDPEALLSEFQSLDRGAPIVGPGDSVVESGNGRVMAVIMAAKDFPEVYKNYNKRLRERIKELGVKANQLNLFKVPILVRERVTKVNRLKFVEEANAATTIERSALETARTDSSKITPEMLNGLQVSDSESLDQAIREPKNKLIIGAFMQKLPANEQARLVDAKGALSQDGVRRIIMAIFVSAFAGDAGLRLAERFFESTDLNVRNVFNGIASALSNLAKMEALCRSGDRPAGYSLADDLARAVTVFSMIRTSGMPVANYLNQHQLFERELTPFQESVLKALGENARSGRRIANILTAYANTVLNQPSTNQASMVDGERPTKAQIFEHAVTHAGDSVPPNQPALVSPAPPPVITLKPVQVCEALHEAKETHAHFLGQPPDPKTGSHEWHRRWINVYGQADKLLCSRKSPAPPPRGKAPPLPRCELVAPKYYDLLSWVNWPLPDILFSLEPEVKERKIDEILKKLREGVEGIQDSDNFKQFLLTMAKFHNYSMGNQMLIAIQDPDASRVAGFNTWKDLGRHVKPGEHGIAILAPCIPAKPKTPKKETEGQGEDEEQQTVELVASPIYFKVVYVFDVKQTEGKNLPDVEVPVLTGEANEALFSSVSKMADKEKLRVDFKEGDKQDPNVKGYYSPLEKKIWIKPDEARGQQLKTFLHEMAHYFTEDVFKINREDAETIAESVAFTVGAHFGFDTGTRSFSYVALWAKEQKALEANLGSIRKISSKMINELEELNKPPAPAPEDRTFRMMANAKAMYLILRAVKVSLSEDEYYQHFKPLLKNIDKVLDDIDNQVPPAPAKLERCVKAVEEKNKQTGYKGNAYAICQASIKKESE